MANEAKLQISLQITNGDFQYRPMGPTAYFADVMGKKGPTPGAISVSTTGTDVSLSQLTQPGLVVVQNLDLTNYVFGGIYDGVSFFPLFEVLPGEVYVWRFYRFLGSEWIGTGTPADVNTFRLRADTAACNVFVGAFEV